MEKKADITIQQAYYWVIRKWNYIVRNDGSEDGLLNKYPRLLDFESQCAYCELFIWKNCVDCPLVPEGPKQTVCSGRCWEDNHPWRNWQKNPTKETAQEVLNLIKKTKPL